MKGAQTVENYMVTVIETVLLVSYAAFTQLSKKTS